MKNIQEEIKTGNFRKAYLLYGEEEYLVHFYRDKLKETQEQENREVTFEGGILVWNYQESRLQVFFNKIPEESKRRELKSSGFHWSPKNRAWQRQLNPNAVSAAKRILNLQNI